MAAGDLLVEVLVLRLSSGSANRTQYVGSGEGGLSVYGWYGKPVTIKPYKLPNVNDSPLVSQCCPRGLGTPYGVS